MKTQFTLVFAMLLAVCKLQAQTPPTIIADGFLNGLIGVDVDADGNVWVTEFGSGNDDGAITIISPDGTKTPFMTGLPSAVNPLTGEVAGSFRTYQMSDNKVLIVVGEGPHTQGEALLIVDKTDFTPGTPLTLTDVEETLKIGDFVHNQGFLQCDPYNVASDDDGNWYVADAGANSIVKIEATSGNLSILKTFDGIPNPLPFGPPVSDFVPTDIVAKPDGSGFYVCNLTGFPFVEGFASIQSLDANGNATLFADGFTCLTDLGYDPQTGNLCAMQFGVFGPVDTTLNFIPGTGQVVAVLPGGGRDTLTTGMIGLNPSFTFDAAGDLYATDLFGLVYKFDLPVAADERQAESVAVKAFPNPFSGNVNIEYKLEQAADVGVIIYDVHGREVMTFAEGKKNAGSHSLTWNAEKVASGVYFYRLRAGDRMLSGVLNKSN